MNIDQSPQQLRLEFHEFRKNTDDRLSMVETQIAVNDLHNKNVEQRLQQIDENTRWLIKLVTGAVILALLSYVLRDMVPALSEVK